MAQHLTRDHETIRKWAEARGARPSAVVSGGSNGGAGILRLDLPGYSGGDVLEEIGWSEWFRMFDEHQLVLLYQETTADGKQSNFNRVVSADTISRAGAAD